MENKIQELKISKEEPDLQVQGYFAKEVLTFKEACLLLGISASALYKITHKKTITFYKPNGKLIYFKNSDLINWMLSNKVESIVENQNNFFNNLIERKNAKSN